MAERTRTPLSPRERRRQPRGAELVPAETLKSHMPGVEPERRLDDWGRSERVEGVFDATVVEFFYRHWFRAEVEGIENVPASGGALLVSNHSGALPPDAAMIGKAIREEHPRPRPLNITVEHFFKGYPGLLDAGLEDRLRSGAPGQRAPAAVRRGAARARLPRGPQRHREALQGPLPAAPLRPRRLRRGRHAGARADRAGLRRRAPRRPRRCSPRSASSRSSPG